MSATSAASVAPRVDERLLLVCGLSWITAVIHLVAAAGHRQEFVLYPVSFVLFAAAQGLWGVAVYRSASRRWLWAGLVMSLTVAGVWIISRTSGIPFGPERWHAESVGTLETIATADELMLAALVFLQLRPSRAGRVARVGGQLCVGGGLCLILLSSLALVGGHAH